MYDEAINILEDTLSAFEKEDTTLARSVFQKDEFLDKINMNATNATCEYLIVTSGRCLSGADQSVDHPKTGKSG